MIYDGYLSAILSLFINCINNRTSFMNNFIVCSARARKAASASVACGHKKNASERKFTQLAKFLNYQRLFLWKGVFYFRCFDFFNLRKEAIMSDDIDLKTSVLSTDKEPVFAIKFVFKPVEPNKVLRTEESQLLRAHIGEILEEIEVEEKLILEEERKAALEVTARNANKEDQ